MISFLIHKPQPKLQAVYSSLKEGKLEPRFQEVDCLEVVTLSVADGGLDVYISFNRQTHKATCLVVTVINQSKFAYYEDDFNREVTGQNLLGWWYQAGRDINSRVLAAKAIELAFA